MYVQQKGNWTEKLRQIVPSEKNPKYREIEWLVTKPKFDCKLVTCFAQNDLDWEPLIYGLCTLCTVYFLEVEQWIYFRSTKEDIKMPESH